MPAFIDAAFDEILDPTTSLDQASVLIEYLLDRHGINVKNSEDYSLLHKAIAKNNSNIIPVLLKKT